MLLPIAIFAALIVQPFVAYLKFSTMQVQDVLK